MQATKPWRVRPSDMTGLFHRAYRFFVTVPLRSRLLDESLVGIPDIAAEGEDFERLRLLVCASGTDSLSYFQGGYTHEGGLFLQQSPEEFAALLQFLAQRGPFDRYLEIGSASGGAALLIHQHVGFDRGISIDDGRHPRAIEQERNFAQIPSLQRFVGDSHSDSARAFLETTLAGSLLDLAFIDGDHSRRGIQQDLELVLPFCAPKALIVLHDTRACSGVERAWLGAVRKGMLSPLAEFTASHGPLGIAVGEVRAR